MSWWLAACILFGSLTVLFALALPAAFAFLGINIVGAWVLTFPGAGLAAALAYGIATVIT